MWRRKYIRQCLQALDDVRLSYDDSREANRIFEEIASGIEFIHSKGLTHKQLKPSNIFLKGSNGNVKIGNFGVTKDPCDPLEGDWSAICTCTKHLDLNRDTVTYAAPEQLESSNYDHKADMFSVGMILFELLHPFTSAMERVRVLADLRDSNGHINEVYIIGYIGGKKKMKAIHELLRQDPSERPSAEELHKLVGESSW